MPTMNATVTLGLVINVKDGVDISNFLLRDTEWIGEPKNGDGCVIAVNPKSFSVAVKGAVQEGFSAQLPQTPSEEEQLPTVKAVREHGKSWNKKPKYIESSVHATASYELMLQNANNSMVFVDIADMVGKRVLIVNKNNDAFPIMVGT